VIPVFVGRVYRPKQCCRILEVASGGYFRWKLGPIPQAELRRPLLRVAIRQAHSASHGTYGYRRGRAGAAPGVGHSHLTQDRAKAHGRRRACSQVPWLV